MKFLARALLFLWSVGASAESIKVFPSGAELTGIKREASFSVTNSGAAPLNVQFTITAWSPEGYSTPIDEAKLLEQKALLVYPPVAKVEAGGRQVFRVILRDRSITDLALFRLKVGWSGVTKGESAPGKLSFGLGYSLPLMITAPNANHQLVYRPVNLDGQLALEITNKGQRPVYIKRYKWADGSEGELFGYVWPNHTRYYKLPKAGPPPVTVQLRTWGWAPSH